MTSISTAAEALKARHGALLRPVAASETETAAEACDALDAARTRLRGSEAPAKDQLTLDLPGR